ncbi:major facilitator superfamily domain-containing protein [Dichotomopilus funicola]|uniref:Major facilitator superfamily domain-containing protein n=1 Tax=Dichotomopilus funicola TaxID=1934379 RepID=A0AAN6ZL94_9PEZI|nr:major facilitator superfamily domain-containing protein [Dichotomopilus funicola]
MIRGFNTAGALGPPADNNPGGPAGPGGGSPESAGAGSRSQPKSRSGASTVSWKDLPRKGQLIVITLTRLSEPLVQTSIQSYMFYQLKWFDPTLPDSAISAQAGVLHASFTAAQFLTAMLWGRAADSSRFGRKNVIFIGLLGTMLSCIGFAFSTSFRQALFFRALGGVTNGNVGVLRTMISEIVREKKYQSRAFLLLPMTFNIGAIIGPILGGLLSDPAGSYPGLFGDVEFFKRFPYATPNIVSAFFLFGAMLCAWLFLEETLDSRFDKRDRGLELGRKIRSWIRGRSTGRGYTLVPDEDDDSTLDLVERRGDTRPRQSSVSSIRLQTPTTPTRPRRKYTQRLPFRRIFTPNVLWTFVANFLLTFHIGGFNSLWFVFLSTPVYDPSGTRSSELPEDAPRRQLPFVFTGGLGLHPREVGMAMSILGVIGISMQLGIYPRLSARLGTIRSWRLFMTVFPLTYFLIPYLSIVPSASPPPHAKDGFLVWGAIVCVLFLQVVGRTFSLPSQAILVNNCTPHPSVLGTVHGIGQSVSSLARSTGPVLGGLVYGFGLSHGVVGIVFWGMSAVALCNIVVSRFVREGDGHEIWLEGDVEENESVERTV